MSNRFLDIAPPLFNFLCEKYGYENLGSELSPYFGDGIARYQKAGLMVIISSDRSTYIVEICRSGEPETKFALDLILAGISGNERYDLSFAPTTVNVEELAKQLDLVMPDIEKYLRVENWGQAKEQLTRFQKQRVRLMFPRWFQDTSPKSIK